KRISKNQGRRPGAAPDIGNLESLSPGQAGEGYGKARLIVAAGTLPRPVAVQVYEKIEIVHARMPWPVRADGSITVRSNRRQVERLLVGICRVAQAVA
ncbi:MAG: hypothetical protein VW362_12630, partial [Candidatus Nanopelagicales bacterium]